MNFYSKELIRHRLMSYTQLVLSALLLSLALVGPTAFTTVDVYAQTEERAFCNDASVSNDAKRRANCPGYRNTSALGSADELGIPDVEANQSMLDRILRTVFIITGAIATVFVIIGGFKYVVSAGNPEGAKSARNTIVSALVGLVISVFAYTIVNFVISNL